MLHKLLQLLARGFSAVVNHRWASYVIDVLGLVLAGWVALHFWRAPAVTTVQTNEHTVTKYVDVPVLNEKTITKILPDPKDKQTISALLAENNALKLRITSLTNTVATLDSRGSGIIVAEKPSDSPVNYHFKDWRLDFTTDLKTANYALSQKFVVLTSTGKDADGKPTTLVSVYEEGPNGERTAVPAQTTAIFANESSAHWFTKLNVQAGLGVTDTKGGVFGVQWLKRGTSNAPGDIRWAAATPVWFVSNGTGEPGLLPVSFNLGTLPHQPFTNLWLSPYVNLKSKFGVVLSATF